MAHEWILRYGALLQGDQEGVLAEVAHMVLCSDFTPSMLHVSVSGCGQGWASWTDTASVMSVFSTLAFAGRCLLLTA